MVATLDTPAHFTRVAASHYSVMTKETSALFVAGPPVVNALGSQKLDRFELGGWEIQTRCGAVDHAVFGRGAHHAAARVRAGAAHVQAGQGAAIVTMAEHRARREHLPEIERTDEEWRAQLDPAKMPPSQSAPAKTYQNWKKFLKNSVL